MMRAASILALATLVVAKPEQVHISLTGRTAEMGVDFVTSAGSHGLMVKFGTSSGTLTSSAPATSTPFTGAGWTATMNYAFMTGLAPATTYYYQVGSDAEGWSQIFSYVNQPETVSPPVFAVFADFGFGNDVSMSDIIADAAAGGFDMILHAGDVAYDLDSSKSQVGNDFMNAFQPAAASKAYMFSTGNHETYGTQGGNKFLQFAARFSSYAAGVGNSSGSGSQLWFSFNVGQIHFLFFCTENVAAPLSPEQMTAQLAFMTADLKAVNRDVTPWVVSVGHKFYSMDTLNWQPYEDVLNPGGVDLHLCGHWHYYGRFFPITSATGTPGKLAVDRASVSADNNTYTDPKYMVGIVSGAPGDIEVNPPTCSVGPLDIHAANAQTCNYGWSKLQAINSTHLHYTFKSTKANDKPVNFTDNFYIVRSSPKKCEL